MFKKNFSFLFYLVRFHGLQKIFLVRLLTIVLWWHFFFFFEIELISSILCVGEDEKFNQTDIYLE